MKKRLGLKSDRRVGLWVMASMIVGGLTVFAQAPAPDNNFNESVDTNWLTPGNWSGVVPIEGNTENLLIEDGKTAALNHGAFGDSNTRFFGTLTLGEGSKFEFDTGNNRGLPNGSTVYFKDGSHLQYTGGSSNRDDNFTILPGASATYTTRSNTFFRGTLEGSGDLTVNANGNFEMRKFAGNYTGDFTVLAASGTRQAWIRQFGPNFRGDIRLGSGLNTFGNNVYVVQDRTNQIHTDGSLRLVGTGRLNANPSNNYKWSSGASQELANLIVESPNQGSGPYFITGNGTNASRFRVNDTASFTGTAGRVQIESKMAGHFRGFPRASSTTIHADNLFFGPGDWTIEGSINDTQNQPADGTPLSSNGFIYTFMNSDYAPGSIGTPNGGDVTTVGNVTLNNAPFVAPNGFTKKGAGTLTLNYFDDVRTVQSGNLQSFNLAGDIVIEGGSLVVPDMRIINGSYAPGGGTTVVGTDSVTIGSGGTLQLGGDGGSASFNPDLSGGGTLDKVGAGTTTIASASNTFSGTYRVSDGTLSVPTNIGTPSGIHVEPGTEFQIGDGVLGGAGGTLNFSSPVSISGTGDVTIGDDGMGTLDLSNVNLSPGLSPGTLPVGGSVIVSGGSSYDWEIADATLPATAGLSTTWDLVTVAGDLTLDSSLLGTPGVINTSGSTAGLDLRVKGRVTGPFEILTFTGDLNPGGGEAFDPSLFSINNGNLGQYGFFTIDFDAGGKAFLLNFTSTVPEPGTWALFGLMLIGGIVAVRRARKES